MMYRSVFCLWPTTVVFAWTFAALLPLSAVAAEAEPPVLEITQDTALDPATTYGRIVIKASGVTVDGRGAWLVGARQGDPKTFQHVAVSAKGVSRVTLKNLNAKGWETGLLVEDGERWLVEGCNFSDNFHDPAFGWGEQGRRGGIVLHCVHRSTFRKNQARRVWDACVLVDSHENTIEENDFSHTSNTGLKMWTACRNVVHKNNLSYGLRIKPGEVHARDSTGVLVESGSNDNRFLENDCTHGGDGIFVRVLNGWVSTGNVFEGNDCSYANNNAFEAWAPRNVYRRNQANHSSYGFWLGASDQTVLEDNEASFNGDPQGHHNSPHLPHSGHAGIVFMFGPSSHTLVRGNTCVGNNGAGIALIGDRESQGRKWRAFHWIIEQNSLRDNRWGLYMQHADWIDVAANAFGGNQEGNLHDAGNVTNLTVRPDNPRIVRPPRAVLAGPSASKVGQPVVLDASTSSDPGGNQLAFRWDLGNGTIRHTAKVSHAFAAPGFYRVGLTVTNGALSDLAWRDFYVVADRAEWGTEGAAVQWRWIDPQSRVAFADDAEVRIAGKTALRAQVEPYGGQLVRLLYPANKKAGMPLADKTHLAFWVKAINEGTPAWQGNQPVIALCGSETQSAVLTPKLDVMSARPNNEEREGWSYLVVPLAGDAQWERQGELPATLNYLTIGFDSWGTPPLRIWLDGMSMW